jgi:hypothetical protein
MVPFYRIDAVAGIGSGRMAPYAAAKRVRTRRFLFIPPAGIRIPECFARRCSFTEIIARRCAGAQA